MTRYVFDSPEAMFHWIDECAKKLLTIPRDEFGKIEINISRTDRLRNYDWLITPEDKKVWKRKLENDKR